MFRHRQFMSTGTSPLPKTLVWFITGTSQGFGRELVRLALERGDSVVATSRDPAKVAAGWSPTSWLGE